MESFYVCKFLAYQFVIWANANNLSNSHRSLINISCLLFCLIAKRLLKRLNQMLFFVIYLVCITKQQLSLKRNLYRSKHFIFRGGSLTEDTYKYFIGSNGGATHFLCIILFWYKRANLVMSFFSLFWSIPNYFTYAITI